MNIVKHVAQRFKKYPYKQVIPFIFTFANALLGMLSILKTFEGEFISASWCIIGAVIVDGIDKVEFACPVDDLKHCSIDTQTSPAKSKSVLHSSASHCI